MKTLTCMMIMVTAWKRTHEFIDKKNMTYLSPHSFIATGYAPFVFTIGALRTGVALVVALVVVLLVVVISWREISIWPLQNEQCLEQYRRRQPEGKKGGLSKTYSSSWCPWVRTKFYFFLIRSRLQLKGVTKESGCHHVGWLHLATTELWRVLLSFVT